MRRILSAAAEALRRLRAPEASRKFGARSPSAEKRWLAKVFSGRHLAILALTAFLASAVLTPQYNPLTRPYVLGSERAGQVWGELNEWRRAAVEAQQVEAGWPADITPFDPRLPDALVTMHSPQPYRLVGTLADRDELGDLAGTQVILDFSPGSRGWTCRPGSPPIPTRYLPINCQEGGGDIPAMVTLRYLILICVLVFVIAGVLLLFRHPLLGPVQMRPASLLRTPAARLPKLDRLLGLLGRRQATLQAAGVRPLDWQGAVAYAEAGPEDKVRALALRIGAACRPSEGWSLPGAVYEWLFSDELPITLDRCLVFVPENGADDETLVQHLRAAQTGLDVMLVLAGDDTEALQAHCADPANLYAAVDGATQTEWLLTRKPAEVLLRVLAAQLRLTRISPYQTRGGVVRPGAFFGRTQVLARVLNREPANYLVVGGRQLGKSSLLKAVQRRLQGHPHIVCHYLSLRDHRLAPRLALQFGLPAATPLEQVIEHIAAGHAGKRLFLLIDEADLFFRDEAAHGYRQLSTLRALSEEGRCWFMLAGFWDLYATAVLDYQSPLRNFGEVVTVGGLEEDACRELATVPLSRLRLGFANDGLVAELVRASGQRANLVAIICQECLEALQPGERVIERPHLERALASQAVQDALAGWGRLSHDEAACRLDRIAVYHTALHGHTSLEALVALCDGEGRRADVDAWQRALSRLVLAYVLRRDGTRYRFAIPLFAQQFEPAELKLLLRQELDGLPAQDG